MIKKIFIKTFGCQMNEYDSDKIADVMRSELVRCARVAVYAGIQPA